MVDLFVLEQKRSNLSQIFERKENSIEISQKTYAAGGYPISSARSLIRPIIKTMLMLMFVILALLSAAVASSQNASCTTVRSAAMATAQAAVLPEKFDASKMVHLDHVDRADRDLIWSGKREGLILNLYNSADEQGMQISPIMRDDKAIEVSVTMPKGVSALEAQAMASRMSDIFATENRASGQCVSANVASYTYSQKDQKKT